MSESEISESESKKSWWCVATVLLIRRNSVSLLDEAWNSTSESPERILPTSDISHIWRILLATTDIVFAVSNSRVSKVQNQIMRFEGEQGVSQLWTKKFLMASSTHTILSQIYLSMWLEIVIASESETSLIGFANRAMRLISLCGKAQFWSWRRLLPD